MWFILSILFIVITTYVHKHSYTYRNWDINIEDWEYKEDDRLKLPLWLFLVGVIILLIPIFNIIVFIIGGVMYILSYYTDDIYFHPTGIVKKITEFFSKEL